MSDVCFLILFFEFPPTFQRRAIMHPVCMKLQLKFHSAAGTSLWKCAERVVCGHTQSVFVRTCMVTLKIKMHQRMNALYESEFINFPFQNARKDEIFITVSKRHKKMKFSKWNSAKSPMNWKVFLFFLFLYIHWSPTQCFSSGLLNIQKRNLFEPNQNAYLAHNRSEPEKNLRYTRWIRLISDSRRCFRLFSSTSGNRIDSVLFKLSRSSHCNIGKSQTPG